MDPRDRPRWTRPLEARARTIPLTSPLRSMPIFRPAPYLAVVAILLPIVAAGVASALLLNENQQPPIWVPSAHSALHPAVDGRLALHAQRAALARGHLGGQAVSTVA